MPSPDLLRERLIAALAAEIGPSLYARSTQQLASALADVAIAEFTSALDIKDSALAEARAAEREYSLEPDWYAPFQAALHALDVRDKLLAGYQAECFEVEQRLGHALGYPIMGPEVGGDGQHVCVGDHAPGTLAAEAANRITALAEARAAAIEECAKALEARTEREYRAGAGSFEAVRIEAFDDAIMTIRALRDPGQMLTNDENITVPKPEGWSSRRDPGT